MPHIPHTPEALLPRSDSRNPSTTCRGLTTNGRPCRRPLASPTKAKHAATRPPLDVAAITRDANIATHEHAGAYFCWQHQAQAESSVLGETTVKLLQGRTSVDTLLDRLGILELGEAVEAAMPKPRVRRARGTARERYEEKPAKLPQRPSLFRTLCCMGTVDEDDYLEVVRHKKRGPMVHSPEMAQSPLQRRKEASYESREPDAQRKSTIHVSKSSSPTLPPTQSYSEYNYVPKTLPPRVASQLLAEASRPISGFDEDGYIYMFWLTDGAAPSQDAATSLLESSSPSPFGVHGSNVRTNQGDKERILVKIGRATNVHRRLSSWSRQCGYNLSLIRFYPYAPSTASPSPSPAPTPRDSSSQPQSPGIRRVPYSHRVERLIHLELASKRVEQSKCGVCGKEHREWFEVEASREGLRDVDGVIRRWIAWAETLHGNVL